VNTDSLIQFHSADATKPRLEIKLLTRLCSTDACPTVYSTNRGTLVVQGYRVSAEEVGIDLPESELLVEIPLDVLKEAARTIG
jgi:hypothetical protein